MLILDVLQGFERPNVRRKHADLNQKNISELLGKKWKLLSPEQRRAAGIRKGSRRTETYSRN